MGDKYLHLSFKKFQRPLAGELKTENQFTDGFKSV